MKRWDVFVVGGGPAGIAAAIQAARDEWATRLVSDEPWGGMVRGAHRLDNLPGFPAGISGRAYAELLEKHLARFPVSRAGGRVVSAVRVADGFLLRVRDENGAVLEQTSRSVILASGTVPRSWEDLQDGNMDRVVHRDARSLPEDLTNQGVVVLGGGEAALDAALVARQRGGNVSILVRGNAIKAPKRLRDEVLAADIGLHLNVGDLRAERDADGNAVLTWREPEGTRGYVRAEHLLVCIGRAPRTELVKSFGPLQERPGDVETLVPGLFLAGDVIRDIDRFVATAIGDGQRAARKAGVYLRGLSAV